MKFENNLTIVRMDGKTGWVRINRPDDRNSINSDLINEIDMVMTELEKASADCVVFSGQGSKFFAGGADAVEMINYNEEQAVRFSCKIQGLYDRIEKSPLISLAAINGLCYGGGLELAMACDFRVAVESARLGLPEVGVGIIPGGGGTQRLSELIGSGRALEMILTGRLCSAEKAFDMGLVHRVVPDSMLVEESFKLLGLVLRNPQHAFVNAKRAFYSRSITDTRDRYKNESSEFGRCFNHDFFVEEISRQLKSGQMQSSEKLKG